MHVERITETQERILTALATYRFLTAAQLRVLGVSDSRRYLYSTLRTLTQRRPAVIGELDFGVLPGRGRLSRLYHLTPAGADAVSSITGAAPPPTSVRMRLFNSDYFHRVNCVDFHIALRQWADRHGIVVDFFHTYFDPTNRTVRGGFHPRTRVVVGDGAIIPDAVFAFTTGDGAQRLCAFEMYNGSRTKYVEKQLAAYLPALKSEAIERTFEYPNAVRTLVVFDDQEATRLALARLLPRGDFEAASTQFFFKTLEEVYPSFSEGWHQLHHHSPQPLY